jgi:hypothetical protein
LNECPKRAQNGNKIDEDPDPGLVEVVPSLDLDNGAHEYAKQEEQGALPPKNWTQFPESERKNI